MRQRDPLSGSLRTVPIHGLATERTRGVRAVTVIGMPRRIPVVEGGVEQANFPVFWARDADVVQTGTEARVIEIQSTVGGRQDHTASIEPNFPQRHVVLIAGLQQASTPVVPCFREEHGFDPLHARPVLLGWMKGRGDGLRRAQVRHDLGRSTHVDQPSDRIRRKAGLKDQPNVLTRTKIAHVRSASVEKLEPMGRLHVPVVPNHGLRPGRQPKQHPPLC